MQRNREKEGRRRRSQSNEFLRRWRLLKDVGRFDVRRTVILRATSLPLVRAATNDLTAKDPWEIASKRVYKHPLAASQSLREFAQHLFPSIDHFSRKLFFLYREDIVPPLTRHFLYAIWIYVWDIDPNSRSTRFLKIPTRFEEIRISQRILTNLWKLSERWVWEEIVRGSWSRTSKCFKQLK